MQKIIESCFPDYKLKDVTDKCVSTCQLLSLINLAEHETMKNTIFLISKTDKNKHLLDFFAERLNVTTIDIYLLNRDNYKTIDVKENYNVKMMISDLINGNIGAMLCDICFDEISLKNTLHNCVECSKGICKNCISKIEPVEVNMELNYVVRECPYCRSKLKFYSKNNFFE
jgi:hypothetical protein